MSSATSSGAGAVQRTVPSQVGNATNTWFAKMRPNPNARLRLFCVPYGGGTAQVYLRWPDGLPPDTEVWSVNLPGRGRRMMEPPLMAIPPMVEAMVPALLPLLDKPFAFFGHSMGSLVSFEVVRQLRRLGKPLPAHLFVSGCFAPHIPDTHPIYHLPDAEFLKELRQLNGMPAEVLANDELMQLVLPSLRAAFTATETYTCNEEPPFSFPLSVFGAVQDPLTTPEFLEAWRPYTSGRFSRRMLPGDHFFLISHEKLLLSMISEDLRQI
jgi:medium-chain acyl-[acyl-carrier-protein] hydrolase